MAIETERLIAAGPASPQEEALERALRPKALSEYVGQEKIRGQLSIFIEAARRRKESLDRPALVIDGLRRRRVEHGIAIERGDLDEYRTRLLRAAPAHRAENSLGLAAAQIGGHPDG